MGLKHRLARIEAKTDLESFDLEDGSRFFYDRAKIGVELFMHVTDCLGAHDQPEWPEPPQIIEALIRAKDRRAACEQFFREGFMMFPYDMEALVERGELVRRSMVLDSEGRHYQPGEPVPCLSRGDGTLQGRRYRP